LAHLLPVLTRRGGGSVVLVGSRAAVRPWESVGAAAYASSKAALVALGQTVAAEVLRTGVRVNVVLPSTLAAADAVPPPPDLLAPASLAAVVRFLLSEEASAVSGAALPVYGPC
jgi:NAD(P)-dependent dehydrogenase (short-subunit alcohol dehydrogenase family)